MEVFSSCKQLLPRSVAADFKECTSLLLTPHLKICEEIGIVYGTFSSRIGSKIVILPMNCSYSIQPF
jgi:hypothetical protein